MNRHVWIGMPCYSGNVWMGTVKALLGGMSEIAQTGTPVSLVDVTGNPLLGMARALLFYKFVHDEAATDLIFLDSDIVFPQGAMTRLLGHPVQFVAGIYPQRTDPPRYTGRPLVGASLDKNGLLEMEGVPGGFLRITKNAAKHMVNEYPGSYFEAEGDPNRRGYALFENTCEDGKFWGEDYSFCKRWRDMGGQIYADPSIAFMHVGWKEFKGVGPWINYLQGER